MTVEVHLTGVLAARAGTGRTYVSVSEDATLADVIDRLSERYGPTVRPALVEGNQLRASASVRRRGNVSEESLSLHSGVSPGDRLRFGLETSAAQPASRFRA
jgi:hypothetical protein